MLLNFVTSDIGTVVAWLCTVGSVIYSLLKRRENRTLLQKIEMIETQISIDEGRDTVTQRGDKNVYTKNNTGGMNIRM